MKLRNWTIEEIEEAIKSIEEALLSGVSQASYQGGGSIQYTSQRNMQTTLANLEKVYEERVNGAAPTRLKRIVYTSRKGL